MHDAAVEIVVDLVDVDHRHAHALFAMEGGERLDRVDQRRMRDDEIVEALRVAMQVVAGDRPREQRLAQIVVSGDEIVDVFLQRDAPGGLHRAVGAEHVGVRLMQIDAAVAPRRGTRWCDRTDRRARDRPPRTSSPSRRRR